MIRVIEKEVYWRISVFNPLSSTELIITRGKEIVTRYLPFTLQMFRSINT